MYIKKIEFDWWQAVVEIDGKPETLELMEEQLLFWMGGQERINTAKGNIEQALVWWKKARQLSSSNKNLDKKIQDKKYYEPDY